MSSDLRVALRFQAHTGNSRREIEQINRDLRKAGKEGAKSLADESWKAGTALTKTGQAGAASYKTIRSAMRETAKAGSDTRIEVTKTAAELKAMANAGRKAARDTKAELTNTDRQGVQPLRQSVERTESSFRRMAQNSGRHLLALKSVAQGVRREFDRIKGLGATAQGQLGALGVGVGVAAGLTGSAKLDRQLIRTKQTADMTAAQKDDWKKEGFRIANDYGIGRGDVDSGFNTLIASGVKYGAAKKTADAIGQTTAVTGADSAILGKAVVAGASAFNIDLNKDGAALDLLQKMTVAGRLGNAELENLADLFPKLGGAASAAGMSLSQALAFTETLSTVEMQPDRLGTLAESTLRIFSTKQYRDQITKSSGVGFFNKKDGSARNPQDVFSDLKRKYSKLETDEQRAKFMGVVFKGMDQDTVRGARMMLTGDRLDKFGEQTASIKNSAPVIGRDLKENTESASGVAGRMRATFGEAVDRMATPLNKGFADMGRYLLDDLNLSGEQMLVGGAALGIGGYYAGRGAKAGAGALMNKFLGGPETLRNIAVGKVLEEATGVTSVFVTNWPGGTSLGGAVPDLPGSSSGNGKSGGFIAPWMGPLALGATATQIGGATGQNSDEDRLAMVARNKLLDEGQRSYQSAFYRNRIALAEQNPSQSSEWLSSQAQRLAHKESGKTAAGLSVDGANGWAAGVANRAVSAGAATLAAEERLRILLEKPLVIEVRSDSHQVMAELERRAGIQVRRGQ
jgi:hypothetical protein